MNKLIRSILTLAATLAAGLGLHAQPAMKLLVVDMAKILDNHYKTEEAQAKFNETAQKVQEQLNEYKKQIEGIGEQAKDLDEQSRNTVLTPENRAKAEQDKQKKIQEYQQRSAEAQNYAANNQRSLQQRMKNYRDLIFEEITKVVKDMAKARGATLVLDKSGLTLSGIPAVVYSDNAYDITDEVLKEVNKDRPAPAPAATTPPAATPAATTPAPAAPAQFTVPNVTKKP
ncbi:MAG: OmpH family outer membrane protein [Opitutales bacterium]